MSEVKPEISYSDSFRHSVAVPRFYKVAANILQLVQEKGQSLKGVIYNCKKHPNLKGIYALVVSCIENASMLDRLVRESQILMKEPRLDPWLARVLIVELVWGKRRLPASTAKPLVTVSSYEASFVGILRDAVRSGGHENEPRRNKAALKPRYIRVNTLLMSIGDAITAFRHEGWRRATPPTDDYPGFLLKLAALEEDEFLQDFHVKQLFAFPPRTEFFGHELYRNGSLILQDKATCLAPLILNPPPGSAVLDMCAAPGIKTTQLAAIMENKGTLYAVERHPHRYKTLCEFVPRHGVTCATTIQADATTVTPQCQEVEYILVDPTCSGSGMDRPASSQDGGPDPNRLAQLAAFQVILLERALTKFPRAQRVVYSTCSIRPEENEQVVEKVLAIVNADRSAWRLAGDALESWPNRGSTEYAVGSRCLVADPDKDLTTGFFVAVFDRAEKSGPEDRKKKKKKGGVEEKETKNGDVERCGEDVGSSSGKKKKKKKKKPIGGDDDISGASERVEGETPGNGTSRETDGNEKVNGNREVSCDNGKKHKKRKKEESPTMTEVEGTGNDDGSERRKRKKERTKDDARVDQDGVDIDRRETSGEGKKKKKKSKGVSTEGIKVTGDTEEVNETGVERKKRKKDRALEEKGGGEENQVGVQNHEDAGDSKKKKKKKKKHKRDEQETGEDNKVESASEDVHTTAKSKHKKRKKETAEV